MQHPIAPVPMVTHLNAIEPGKGHVNGRPRTKLGRAVETAALVLVAVSMVAAFAAQTAAAYAGGTGSVLAEPLGAGPANLTSFGFWTGSFVKQTATGNQDIPLPSGCPDLSAAAAGSWALMFWTTGSDAASGTWRSHAHPMVGFTTGAAQSVVAAANSQDALATSSTTRDLASKCIRMGDNTVDPRAEADFVSFPDATHARINWTTNSNAGEYASMVINFSVFTGLTNAKAITWALPATATTTAISTVGFKPDLLLHAGAGTTALPQSTTGAFFHFGMMNKHGQQVSNAYVAANAVNPSNVSEIQQTDGISIVTNTDVEYDRFKFVSMDTNGFTMQTTGTSSSQVIATLALLGVSSKIGAFAATGTTQTITTNHKFTVLGALFSTYGQPATTTGQPTTRWALGADDGTNRRLAQMFDVDNLTPTRVRSEFRNDAAIGFSDNAASPTDYGLGTPSYTSTTIAMTYAGGTPASNEYLYLLLGASGTNTLPKTIASSTIATATGYSNQKVACTLSDGTLVVWGNENVAVGTPQPYYSKDGGFTWSSFGSGIAGWSNGSIAPYVDSGATERMVAVWKQTGTGGSRTDGYIYVMCGAFNAGRTTLTWGSAVQVGPNTGYNYPDLAVVADGTGASLFLTYSFQGGTDVGLYRNFCSINSSGVVTAGADTSDSSYYTGLGSTHCFPSCDINPTTKDVYVGFSKVGTGAGKGLRFKKYTYSSLGVWTAGTEREVDNTGYMFSTSYTIICRYNAAQGDVYIDAALYTGSTTFHNLYKRDAADTTTTTYTIAGSGGGWFGGGMTVDTATGDVYLVGRTANSVNGLYYVKWVRSSTTVQTAVLVDADGNSAEPFSYAWFSGSTIRWVYTAGNVSPYPVRYDQLSLSSAPNAPTLTSPASGTYMDVSGGFVPQATYNSTDGSNQNAYALRAKRGAGSYVYWNASTSLWQSTIVWNTISTAPAASWSVSIPASATIANGATLNWSFASQESIASLQGPFAADFTIVMQAAPGLTVTAPTGTVTGTLTPRVLWTASPPAGAAQTNYRLVIYTPAQYGAGGFSPGVSAGYYDSGVIGSVNQFADVPAGANLQAGVAYRFYVQITETGGETSTWQFTSATLTVNPPADPTIVATPGTDGTTLAPRTAVTVQGRDNLLSGEQASLEAGTAAGWAAGANTVVGATGFANLLTAEESSFEGGTTAGWTPTGATAANSTVQAAQGTHSMTLTATGANVISASTPTGLSGFAVTASTRYTALASFRTVVTARSMSVQVLWYQASGAASAVRASDTGTAVTDATGSWTQGFVSAVAPSDAAFAAVVVLSNVAVVLSEVHYVDAISLAQGFDLRWALGGTTPATLAVDGQHSLALAALAGANPASAVTPTGTSGFAVQASQQVTGLASFRAAATARTCTVQINWYQASGAASAVRASDLSGGTADSTSAWTQVSLTVTAPSDAAFASLTLFVNGALALGEEHFVDVIDIGPGSSTVWTRGGLNGLTYAVVQFSDNGTTWTNLRTSGASFVFPGQTMTIYDYEAPPGAVRQYRAQVQANVGGSAVILSNIVSTSATGTIPTQWVLSDPTDPTSGLLFHSNGSPSRQLVTKATLHAPFGRGHQVKVSDGTKGWSGRLPVRTTTTAAQVKLEALLAKNVVLLIQSPEGGGRQWYANIDTDPSLTQIGTTLGSNALGGVAGRGTTKMPHTDNVLSYAEAERP